MILRPQIPQKIIAIKTKQQQTHPFNSYVHWDNCYSCTVFRSLDHYVLIIDN